MELESKKLPNITVWAGLKVVHHRISATHLPNVEIYGSALARCSRHQYHTFSYRSLGYLNFFFLSPCIHLIAHGTRTTKTKWQKFTYLFLRKKRNGKKIIEQDFPTLLQKHHKMRLFPMYCSEHENITFCKLIEIRRMEEWKCEKVNMRYCSSIHFQSISLYRFSWTPVTPIWISIMVWRGTWNQQISQ